MKKEKLYYRLTKALETSKIGLFIGIASGVAINVATSQSTFPLKVILALVSLGFSVNYLVRLNNIRQDIDNDLKDLQGIPLDSETRWKNAIKFGDKKRVKDFFRSCLSAAITMLIGILFVYFANIDQAKQVSATQEIDKRTEVLEKKVDSLRDSLNSLSDFLKKKDTVGVKRSTPDVQQ